MATYTAQFKANQAKAAPAKPTAKPASRVKRTVVNNNVQDVTPKPTLSESIHDDIKGLFTKYNIAVPSSTRLYVSYVAQLCIGLGIGFIGSIILETLVITALMFTGSVFFGMTVYILGMLAMFYAAWKAGGWVGDFIVTGDIDRCYKKCSNKVRGFFSFGDKEVTA